MRVCPWIRWGMAGLLGMVLAGVGASCLHAADPAPPPGLQPPAFGRPMYLMEYHVWFKSPFGPDGYDGFVHWDITNERAEVAAGPDWMRDKAAVGYPLPGLYNSEDQGIIRWQLQTIRGAGRRHLRRAHH